VGVLVTLLSADFFVAWDGRAISAGLARSEEARERVVHVQGADGSVRAVWWPTEAVTPLTLPVDPLGLATPTIDDARPATSKQRFSLSFDVELDRGLPTARTVSLPTLSPRDLGLGALAWLLLIGVRNMIVARSPLAIARPDGGVQTEVPRGDVLPFPRTPTKGASRPKPGPPPPPPRRGVGRR